MNPEFSAPAQPDYEKHIADLKKDIASHERLVTAIYRMLPAFVTESAIERMGINGVAGVLLGFHDALRHYMCGPMEEHLEHALEVSKNPPKPPMYFGPKPTPEDLYRAQTQVTRLEEALAAMEHAQEKENYGLGAAAAMMRPLVEQQLDYARQSLERIQSALDAPDEADPSSMSNETPAGEATKPE